jgi:hypothetical protein
MSVTCAQKPQDSPTCSHACLICGVIVRRQEQEHCASITRMIRHYVARRAQVTEGHPHNAESSVFPASAERMRAGESRMTIADGSCKPQDGGAGGVAVCRADYPLVWRRTVSRLRPATSRSAKYGRAGPRAAARCGGRCHHAGMTHLGDLTLCRCLALGEDALNVGWLGSGTMTRALWPGSVASMMLICCSHRRQNAYKSREPSVP